MKKNRRIIRLCVCYCLNILVASMLGTSCVDEDIPGIEMSGEGIHFGVSFADNSWKGNSRSLAPDTAIVIHKKISKHSMGLSLTIEDGISSPATDGVASRGQQYLDNTLNEFKVAAYYFYEGTVRDYFVNANGKNGLLVTDGVNTETTMYWPLNGTLDFLAISPKDVVDEMPLATTYTPENGIAFTYSLDPDAIKTHTDVMAAFTNDINKKDNPLPVNLSFKHLFAAVQFKLGKMLFIDINSITVTGVKGGTISFIRKKEGSGWEYAASKDNESYVISKGNAVNQEGIDTYGMAEGAAITSNEQGTMLFVMPQELTSEAKLIVNYDNYLTQETNVTEECPLVNQNVPSSMAWEAGKIYAYALNIGDEFNVTIPAPANQDAHYVMVPMPYDLGDLSSNISNITASVSYINNTADQDVIPTLKLGSTNPAKTALADLEGLTDLQKQGYWTDKQYTAADDGTLSGGVGVRGDESGKLILNNNQGTIVMFLPENTGKTDRDVVLTITGTATVGKESVELTIGKCQFKQLCPSWVAYNEGYIGSERIVESIYTNDDGRYPYGFKWNRKVEYSNGTPLVRLLYSNAIASLIGNVPFNTVGTYTVLNGFVTYTVKEASGYKYIEKITLNYAAINNLGNTANNENDGEVNTNGLYNFTAGVNPNELEAKLDSYVKKILWFFDVLTKKDIDNSKASSEYAAFTAIKRNKFNEISRTFKDESGDNGDVTTIVPKLTAEGIVWYLPSINEGLKIKDNGDYALKADDVGYWSSTSYEDNSNSKAYYFIYNPNGDNQSSIGDRTSPERRVRAVVQWKGDGNPLE